MPNPERLDRLRSKTPSMTVSLYPNVQWPNFAVVTAMNYDLPNMEVGQWNLSLQRQISNQWLVSANYLGTKTSHMWTLQQLNPSVFLGLEPCTLGGVQYATCSTTSNNDARRRLNLTCLYLFLITIGIGTKPVKVNFWTRLFSGFSGVTSAVYRDRKSVV